MTAVALVGVTASGKSEAALELAVRRGDCELVSVDSMCVYRGMDVGTSKPDAAARAAVPHHLLDLVEPDQEFTVTQFQRAARLALADIERRGRHAVLVGGTGLYLRSVVDDLAIPGRFPDVAAELEAELDEGRRRPRGPARAPGRTGSGGGRAHGTDQPPARVACARGHHRGGAALLGVRSRPGGLPGHGVPQVGIALAPDEVDRRVAARFAAMVEKGLVEEVRALLARPGGLSRTARQALGYREILCHLEQGVPLDDCLAEAVQRTRQFARRQASWFRRDPRITWAGSGHEAQHLVADVLDVHG